MNVLYPALHKSALDPLVAAVKDAWYNQTLARVNDSVIRLGPREGFVVPKGVRHRTRAPNRAVILMFETSAVIPTGS